MILYNNYKRGFLLYDGGISDQPNWYVEAMGLIDREVNQRESEKFDAIKRRKGLK